MSTCPDAAERGKTLDHQENTNRKRILVVEDNRVNLMLLHQLLKAHGYEILQTPEGWEAIDLARNKQPDLILVDIRLPDISGLDDSADSTMLRLRPTGSSVGIAPVDYDPVVLLKPFGPRLAADALPSEDSSMAAPGQPIRVPAFAVVPH